MTEIKFRSDMTVELIQHMGGDSMIVNAARVSTGRDRHDMSVPKKDVEPMVNFLMKNRHGTPFEHGAMTFRIEAPIFVFREFHRHRIGWSYNEESGRYKQLDPVFYVPAPDRNLVQRGKPGAYEFVPGDGAQHGLVSKKLRDAYENVYEDYQLLLDAGIAREVARIPLPVGIYSSMYATCNPRSLMAFLSLRTKNADSTFPSFPQREIEMVAEQMELVFSQFFPVTWAAFRDNGRVAP